MNNQEHHGTVRRRVQLNGKKFEEFYYKKINKKEGGFNILLLNIVLYRIRENTNEESKLLQTCVL